MQKIKELLLQKQDLTYKEFIAKLTPNINMNTIIGVRNPDVRELAKRIFKGDLKDIIDYKEFFLELPHEYYEENMLHSLLLEQIKDYDYFVLEMGRFLPYIDNWAVCDTMKCKVIIKNKEDYIHRIKKYIASDHTYTIRFGIGILMSFYLDEDFKEEYLSLVASVKSDEYYVNMMIAWYFATALAKHYNETIRVLEEKWLDVWTHNKTISKCVDSFRILEDQKIYLKSLRIKK